MPFCPGDAEWEAFAIGNAPALAVGDLIKPVGLSRSKDSPAGFLRKAGLS